MQNLSLVCMVIGEYCTVHILNIERLKTEFFVLRNFNGIKFSWVYRLSKLYRWSVNLLRTAVFRWEARKEHTFIIINNNKNY